jgi:Ca2+-binding EF-hand superfamily protein
MEKLHGTFKYLKKVFNDATNKKLGGLDRDGLVAVMDKLHGELDPELIDGIFLYADVRNAHVIRLKEFLVALTVEYILGKFPLLNLSISSSKMNLLSMAEEAEQRQRQQVELSIVPGEAPDQPGVLTERRGDLRDMLDLIIGAYFLFDTDGLGVLLKANVEKVLEESGHKSGTHPTSSPMLSEQIWKEMDWNEDGSLDFAAFVFEFSGWIDIDGELEGER